MTDLQLPLTTLVRDMCAGTIDAASLLARYLHRIEELNSDTHTYITVAQDRASTEREYLGTRETGSLFGLPYAVKDLFLTGGILTTGGSRVLGEWVPEVDANLVSRARQAGARLLGKLNLHELAHGTSGENAIYGTPPNPFDHGRMPGGSSSGSAVAVACGLASFALGTDTGGSVRVPASLCGVVGFKPSFGVLSRTNIIPYSWSLDHVGTLTRRVADAALVICALAGHDPEDPGSVEISGAELNPEQANAARLRVGYPHAYVRARSDAAVAAVTEQVVARLRKQGLPVTEIDFPDFPHVRTVSLTIQMPEVLSYHRRFLPDRLHLYSPELRGGLAFGQFILAEHYVRALRMVEHYRRVLARTFTEIDILLLPTTPVTAPPIGTEVLSTGGSTEPLGDVLTRFTALFNMTGNPALAMPCGQDENGLPFSVQLVGRPYEDAFVLAVGEMMEAELGLLWASTYFDGGG